MKEDYWNIYWGINENISPFEIFARATVMFLAAFFVIRITGMRAFRENNPFDLVIAFLIGGILSRGVVGATPFISALAGGTFLIILHKLFLRVTLYSKWLERIIKGEPKIIYKDGKFIEENMKQTDITLMEVYEDLRVDNHSESLEEIDRIYVEKTGEISFVRKNSNPLSGN